MKILYLVHFNAPMGGLHENVYASSIFMQQKGHEVHVVLKDGELKKRFENQGINTITTDYSNVGVSLKIIEDKKIDFDIIHAHPGASRKVALHYSGRHNIPLVMTYHGMWSDSLKQYIDKVSAVVCVSEGIKDFIQTEVSDRKEKFFVMPNGFNNKLFNEARLYKEANDKLQISFISRLDSDKEFILEIFKLALIHLKKYKSKTVIFNIIGDGILREKFLEECQDLLSDTHHRIEFKGWLVDNELKQAYLQSDIVIAPGRSVIEAMACGKPVVAVGSKKYIGLIKDNNWQIGMYNNFGGFGNKFDDYEPGNIESDLDILLNNENNINLLGKFSYDIATTYFNASSINNNLYNLYKTLHLQNKMKNAF